MTKENKVLLEVKNLKKSFDNKEILKGITVNINKGDVVCVIGPSGSRKINIFKMFKQIRRS